MPRSMAIFEALAPDIVQLHGRETPERVEAIGARYGKLTMKALGVAEAEDFAVAERYVRAADMLLIDAKPPKSAVLPGGNGVAFDWRLARGFSPGRPWLLSGGSTRPMSSAPSRESNALGVDVSSGVERAPGEKDPDKIKAFIAAARRAFQRAAEHAS